MVSRGEGSGSTFVCVSVLFMFTVLKAGEPGEYSLLLLWPVILLNHFCIKAQTAQERICCRWPPVSETHSCIEDS